jgi:hypothetical protein
MESIGKSTLIHAGIEVAVIGGVVFWTKKKFDAQQYEIDQLRADLNLVRQQNEKLMGYINQHHAMLNQIFGGRQAVPQIPPLIPRPPQQQDVSQSPQTQSRSPSHSTHSTQSSRPQPKPKKKKKHLAVSDEVLDAHLEAELREMQADDPIELDFECDGDSCPVPPKKSGLKKKTIV